MKGNKLFAGDFMLIWTKQTLIWFSLQRDGTGNRLSNVNLHQSLRIFKAGSYDVMAGQNIYKKNKYTLDKGANSRADFLDFRLLESKLMKFLVMSFIIVMTHNSSGNFDLIHFLL